MSKARGKFVDCSEILTSNRHNALPHSAEHHDSLRREFPRMRSIALLGNKVTGWQVPPADAPEFESSPHACELVVAGDPRIGKVPKPKRRSTPHAAGGSS
jgi:hypothetical protein